MSEQEEAHAALKALLAGALEEVHPPDNVCRRPYCPYLSPRQTHQEAVNDASFCSSNGQTRPDASHSSDKNGANLFKAAPFFIIFLQMVWRCLIAVYAAPLLGLQALAALFTQCQTNYHPTYSSTTDKGHHTVAFCVHSCFCSNTYCSCLSRARLPCQRCCQPAGNAVPRLGSRTCSHNRHGSGWPGWNGRSCRLA